MTPSKAKLVFISFTDLIAIIDAVLRRSKFSKGQNIIEVGDISINKDEYRVFRDGVSISLGPTEFKLLNCLVEHPNMVFSREKLLDSVWGCRQHQCRNKNS